ncbi:MAG: glycosyltransferase [Chloroflexota bacterium]|nr:glycosyltransferase [Chloroflexota bacterium]
MRALFTTTAGSGHFHPLVPVARALVEAGHEVAVAAPGSFGPTVEASGLRAFPAGRDDAQGVDPELAGLMGKLMELDHEERETFMISRIFGGYNTRRMVPDLIPLCREWKPDVVVRELAEFGGAIAAESLGIPHAAVQIGHFVDLPASRTELAAQLDQVRHSVGLPPDPDLEMLYRYLLLSLVPPSYQEPNAERPPTMHHLQTVVFDRSGSEMAPPWLTPDLPRPVIYATFGTEMPNIPPLGVFPGLFQAVIEALRDEAGTLIVTVSRGKDPAELGPQPPHVHVERYLPQSLLLSYCDLVVTHGGHNTVLAALAQGLPLVVIPIAADQPENARRCADLGLGRVVEPGERTPDVIRAAAREVLGNPRYRQNAAALRAEMESLPGPERAVELLEGLASEKTPRLAEA